MFPELSESVSVARQFRRWRNIGFLIIVVSWIVSVSLLMALGDEYGLWPMAILIATGLAVGYLLNRRVRCPCCGHQLALKKRFSHSTAVWDFYSPTILDYCPKCSTDLDTPYQTLKCREVQ